MLAQTRSRVVFSDQVFLFGAEAAGGRLAQELHSRGWRRVLLMADPFALESPAYARLRDTGLDGLQVQVLEHRIRSHAPIRDTEKIADSLRGAHLDALVVLGGGSVSDTAKGVSVLLAEGGHLEDHCSVFRPPDQLQSPELSHQKTPIVAVPTTLAGAEITPGSGATDDYGVKRTFYDHKVAARLIAFDPAVLAGVPDQVLITTGMNGIAHCAEGLYSITANPLSSAQAIAGAAHLSSGLRRLAGGDRSDETMNELGAGAALGGLVIGNARVGLHHAICHVLGAKAGLPHGVANSIMLPHVMRFNYPSTEAPQRAFAQAVRGSPTDQDPSRVVTELRSQIGAPQRLRDTGLEHSMLDMIAADTMQDRGLYFNPRRVESPAIVRTILEEAW